MIPKKIFFTKGVGRHKDYLQSFELALREAGIEKCNLVNVSSILPPNAKLISREQGLQELKPGEITFCVMARNSTNEPNRLIASSIGSAVPAGEDNYGYLSEHHSFGETEKLAGQYAEDLAATMLASTLGIEFDASKNYDERLKEYKLSGKIVRARSVTQSALGDKSGIWTTVVAVAVFVNCEHDIKENIKQDIMGEIKPEAVQEKKPAEIKPQNNSSNNSKKNNGSKKNNSSNK